MLKLISIIAFIYLASFLGEGEALTCYHCYDFSNQTKSLGSYDGDEFGQTLVRCGQNVGKWNTFACPVDFPVCIVTSRSINNQSKVLRTCGVLDYCSKYKPPQGVKVESCRECDTDLCNNPTKEPGHQPVKADALFKFNINLNLNVIKKPKISEDGSK